MMKDRVIVSSTHREPPPEILPQRTGQSREYRPRKGKIALAVTGVMIELIKNILQLLSTSTGGIGELANFLIGTSYVMAAGFIYKHKKTKKTAIWACVISSIVMGIAAAIVNYFILLPLFETFMPLDQLIASFGEFLPFIETKLDVVLFNALPFNILKGLVIGAITMMIYKKLTPILKGETLK